MPRLEAGGLVLRDPLDSPPGLPARMCCAMSLRYRFQATSGRSVSLLWYSIAPSWRVCVCKGGPLAAVQQLHARTPCGLQRGLIDDGALALDERIGVQVAVLGPRGHHRLLAVDEEQPDAVSGFAQPVQAAGRPRVAVQLADDGQTLLVADVVVDQLRQDRACPVADVRHTPTSTALPAPGRRPVARPDPDAGCTTRWEPDRGRLQARRHRSASVYGPIGADSPTRLQVVEHLVLEPADRLRDARAADGPRLLIREVLEEQADRPVSASASERTVDAIRNRAAAENVPEPFNG